VELIKLPPEAERRLFSECVHETGHGVVALAYGLKPRTYIGGAGFGVCKFVPGTAWQNTSITFGGVLAEDLLGARNPLRTIPRCELTAATFGDWLNEFLYAGGLEQLHKYSASDAEDIKMYDQSRECARAAFKILDANRELLKEAAGDLLECSRIRFWKNEYDPATAEEWCLSFR
jgi:hypothetical protein